MKKVTALATTIGLFATSATQALAAVNINANPSTGTNANTSAPTVINNIITIAIVVAALVVLFFMILGAFQWLTSGGDKEKIGKARGMIINAVIGLALIALAYLLANVVVQLIGLNLNTLSLPQLF